MSEQRNADQENFDNAVLQTDKYDDQLEIINLEGVSGMIKRVTTNSKSQSDIEFPKKKKKKKKLPKIQKKNKEDQFFNMETIDFTKYVEQKQVNIELEDKDKKKSIFMKQNVDELEEQKQEQILKDEINDHQQEVISQEPAKYTFLSVLTLIFCHKSLIGNLLYFTAVGLLQVIFNELGISTCWCQSIHGTCRCNRDDYLYRMLMMIKIMGLLLGPIQFSYDLLGQIWVGENSQEKQDRLRDMYQKDFKAFSRFDSATPWAFKDSNNLFLILYGFGGFLTMIIGSSLDSNQNLFSVPVISSSCIIFITCGLLYKQSGGMDYYRQFLRSMAEYILFCSTIILPMSMYVYALNSKQRLAEQIAVQIGAFMITKILNVVSEGILFQPNLQKYCLLNQFFIQEGVILGNYSASSLFDALFFFTIAFQIVNILEMKTNFCLRALQVFIKSITNLNQNTSEEAREAKKNMIGLSYETFYLIFPFAYYIWYDKLLQICSTPSLNHVQRDCQFGINQNKFNFYQAILSFVVVKFIMEVIMSYVSQRNQRFPKHAFKYDTFFECWIFWSMLYSVFEISYVSITFQMHTQK